MAGDELMKNIIAEVLEDDRVVLTKEDFNTLLVAANRWECLCDACKESVLNKCDGNCNIVTR